MERLKQSVEFHLIALSCSFSRLSKAVMIVTNVKGLHPLQWRASQMLFPGFGLKRLQQRTTEILK